MGLLTKILITSALRSAADITCSVADAAISVADMKRAQHEKEAAYARAAMNNNAATPAMIVKMQDIVNYACSVIDETKQDKRVILQERMNQLWQKLK